MADGAVEQYTIKVENLSDCVMIPDDVNKKLFKKLQAQEQNIDVLTILEEEKVPYLFTSEKLLLLVSCTESLKTKITMIRMIAPRLTDPKAKMDDFLGLFRFSEQKKAIEDALKARAASLNRGVFKQGGGLLGRQSTKKNLSATPSDGERPSVPERGSGGLKFLSSKPREVYQPRAQSAKVSSDVSKSATSSNTSSRAVSFKVSPRDPNKPPAAPLKSPPPPQAGSPARGSSPISPRGGASGEPGFQAKRLNANSWIKKKVPSLDERENKTSITDSPNSVVEVSTESLSVCSIEAEECPESRPRVKTLSGLPEDEGMARLSAETRDSCFITTDRE
jgi:hypothetical protein